MFIFVRPSFRRDSTFTLLILKSYKNFTSVQSRNVSNTFFLHLCSFLWCLVSVTYTFSSSWGLLLGKGKDRKCICSESHLPNLHTQHVTNILKINIFQTLIGNTQSTRLYVKRHKEGWRKLNKRLGRKFLHYVRRGPLSRCRLTFSRVPLIKQLSLCFEAVQEKVWDIVVMYVYKEYTNGERNEEVLFRKLSFFNDRLIVLSPARPYIKCSREESKVTWQ